MSTDQILFEHYDGVVDSPEAVSKLRNFIFDYGGTREISKSSTRMMNPHQS